MARQCKILNVAEKNDAARELSKVMAGGRVQRVNILFTDHHIFCVKVYSVHVCVSNFYYVEGRILQIQ